MLDKILICTTERMRTEESTISRQRRRMRRCQHKMTVSINESTFLYSIGAPQNKHQMLPVAVKTHYHFIGKCFPTFTLMRSRSMSLHGKSRVEQQHTLSCPPRQISIGRRHRKLKIVLYLLKYIDERWRQRNTVTHRETQSVGLSWTVIRILTENDNFYFVKRTFIKSRKNS